MKSFKSYAAVLAAILGQAFKQPETPDAALPRKRNNQKTGHQSFRSRSQQKRRIHARQKLSRGGR